MKKFLSVLLAALMVAMLVSGCGEKPQEPETPEEPSEIIVFAAASLTESLTEIGSKYEAEHPGTTVTFNFDSSGTLRTQIIEGSVCDLFISASPKQMNQLDLTADAELNPDGNDFVVEGTRVKLLENKVALCVTEGNPKEIQSFDDLKAKLPTGDVLFALGNSDVPIGGYTLKIFDYLGLDEAELQKVNALTYGTNVKEVTTQITQGAVDCGVIFVTDANSAGLTIVDTATAEMCGQAIYPAAVMKSAANPEGAADFLSFLQSDAGRESFQKVGFELLA